MRLNVRVNAKQVYAQTSRATVADLADALYLAAEEIMTDCKQNYVPVVSGDLRRSGFVEEPIVTNTNISVPLGFGGSAAPYAVVVHEAPPHWGQRKRKYLSKAVNAAVPSLPSTLARHIRAKQASQRGVV